MTQEIKQANVFGRIGSNLGKSLAEMAPRESERYSLSQGLKQLGEKKNLSPYEQFSELASIRGITPQMIHSGSELLKQQGISNELIKKGQQEKKTEKEKPNPFESDGIRTQGKNAPSLTTREPIDYALNPYIPMTREQKLARAGQLFEENPGLYGKDPNKAIAAANEEDITNQSISNAQQAKRNSQQDVTNRVTEGLKNQVELSNAKIPANVYSDIEDKAINSVKPIEKGGEGLTEQEAKKKYKDEIVDVSKDYQDLQSLGNYTLPSSTPKEIKRKFKSIREGFKKRDDLENLAETYVAENGLSYGKAYYLAYDPADIKELNNELVKLTKITPISFKYGSPTSNTIENEKLNNLAYPKLAKAMDKEGSPLAIAEVLNSKGYDGQGYLDYVNKNRKKLDISERQGKELQKKTNWFPNLNDNWLFLLSGLDELVEQE